MIGIEELDKLQPSRYPRNDIGASTLFCNIYKENLLYVIERKSFFVYDGKVWRHDIDSLQTHALAKEFATSAANYFNSKEHENEDSAKFYAKYFSYEKRCKLIRDAMSVNPKPFSIFDKQPYLFNCQNCTVNLTTGAANPHDPYDYLTKISNVWYDPEESGEEFQKFISDIMQDNSELIEYLKRALGYSLSAATFQECFFITYGESTRNGKGTLNSTMQNMMGDYAKSASYETFESKKYKSGGGGTSEDIARLAGARYVSVSEPQEGMTLDSALIKMLSGNDTITARNLYEKSFEFVASFKIWINTNHLPNISDDTVFKSGRVQLIPFNRHFGEDEQDKGLKARLTKRENISGAFNWCMEGFQLMATEGGLKVPEVIRQEIEAYRAKSDRIGMFLEDCYKKAFDPMHREKMSEVYKIYKWWLADNGYKGQLSKKKFKQELEKKTGVESYGGQDVMIGFERSDIVPDTMFY
ncbi:hypothetical protein EAI89_05595 [Eubacterium sp. am_0171]|uniref:Uncharacterized conserved protein n=1 Tax=Faecalicatena contorta TaxID=39482 RepID=A0A174BTY0_9FIRM|nr:MULTISPECIES: phage/plasmid primase, P4 family [Clostridia]MSC83185.1 hypothetical protein [Eubacterium sp. BIOML-A1]MSD05673.1 hypothetical protein [Eubacterium sp. BIOML-A2]RYT24567.1 hypothetical protein EAI89_05595 [Eubacterium sp. am_0171]CUO04571.1 Uncharacterized conserved protein [[Eubacterium] contortum] [Faecalicatena contorta]